MSLRVKRLQAQLPEETGRPVGSSPSFRDLFSPEFLAAAPAEETGPVVGMFLSSGDAGIAEICAGAGFDYLLIDAEHSPLSLESVQAQLRVIAGYPTVPVVRLPVNNQELIKQYLDLGAQSIILPMVDTPEQAVAAAKAVAYPPEGVRGIGAALARSARWGRVDDYLLRARETITLLVQIETQSAVSYAEAIIETDGVDGIFIGPSDLSASMGYLGQQNHAEVVSTVKSIIAKVKDAGKIVGVNAFNFDQAKDYVASGADFVNVSADVALLARAAENTIASWR